MNLGPEWATPTALAVGCAWKVVALWILAQVQKVI